MKNERDLLNFADTYLDAVETYLHKITDWSTQLTIHRGLKSFEPITTDQIISCEFDCVSVEYKGVELFATHLFPTTRRTWFLRQVPEIRLVVYIRGKLIAMPPFCDDDTGYKVIKSLAAFLKRRDNETT